MPVCDSIKTGIDSELLNGRPHVLLGVTGSVAAVKAPELAQLLCQHSEVKVVVTDAASNFLTEDDFPLAAQPLLSKVCW